MSVPKPPSSLDNSCAVIHDKTLYTFSPEGFLSLPLKQGAKWKKLPMGEKVTGAKCVGTDPGDAAQAGLFVIGGISGSADYAGLQKFTYSTGEWTKIVPTDTPTKNRQWHGATYIKAVDRLLVYAGKQDDVQGPSSETFTIQASEPWEVRSFTPGDEQQLTAPILLPWSDADAMMLGGDPLSTRVSLFNQDTQWRSWTSLADPLPRDTSTINAIVVNGDDGSKSLLIFDMGASPNQVKRVVLSDASGAPVANSAPVLSKKDLTLDDWPEYNSTLASEISRTNYAMAQGADGMVVFAGGNAEEPLAIFDTKENTWMNATNVLVEEQQKILAETESSTATSSTATSSTDTSSTISSTASEITSSATSTIASTSAQPTAAETSAGAAAADSSGDSDGLGSNVILGITLGSIVGFLLFLGLILICLRRRKNAQTHTEAGHARRSSGMPIVADEKDSRGFANGAVPPTSPGHFRGHQPQGSQDSFSSMAILMGRMGGQKQNSLSRKASHDTARTSISSVHKQFKSTISKPIPHAEPTVMEEREREERALAAAAPAPRPRNGGPPPQDGMRRSSGWNRYWSGGSALQLLGFGPGKRNTGVSEQSSRYSESPHNNPRATQDSATVPPLNFEGRASMNRVNSGSPVVSQHTERMPFREGLSGKIERPVSRGSEGGYSSGIPESVNEAWDPTAGDKPWGADRAPSSAYTPSYYYGTSLAPSNAGSRQPPPASGVSKQPQLAMASNSSDMSWLNLGDQRGV